MKKVPASEFKATCLALMDEVQLTGEPILVTKHGQPVAQLVPAPPAEAAPEPFAGRGMGLVGYLGDIVSPGEELWDAERE